MTSLYNPVQLRPLRTPLDIAARDGNLKALKRAFRTWRRLYTHVFAHAATGGHIHVLEWLHENRCPCDAIACRNAAMHGSLAVLKWLREREYPWDENVLHAAIRNDRFDIFEWAWENGCPRGENLCAVAWTHCRLHFVHWMHTHGCTCGHLLLAAGHTPVQWAYHEAVAWLYTKDPRLAPWAQHWLRVVREQLTARLLPDVAKHIVEKYI